MVPKFRAWNGYRKIMADYVSAIQNGETLGTPSSVNVIVKGKNETWDIKNDHVELLQSTGLKDANGKEIYEGDIVKIHVVLLSPDDKVGYVEYHKKYGYSLIMNDRRCRQEYWANDNKAVYEVIGNVHENPELLEAQNERN